VDALVKLAELYLGAGDVGMTLLLLDRAQTAEPRRSEVHNLRGVALERAGEPDAAYQALRKAVELDGKNTTARLNLAAHYAAYGYLDEASAELRRAGGSYAVRGVVSEHPALGALSRVTSGVRR
jgi:Flp pilus assembly protein TadD